MRGRKTAPGTTPLPPLLSVQVEIDVVSFDRHPVPPHPQPGIVEGAARLQVELPVVPGALEDLTLPLPGDVVGAAGADMGPEASLTEGTALVRADILDGMESAVDVEDADTGPAACGDDLSGAGRQILDLPTCRRIPPPN